MTLDLTEALKITLDLAYENALDPMTCSDVLVHEAWRQEEALQTVEAFLYDLQFETNEQNTLDEPITLWSTTIKETKGEKNV